jgi:UDP-4-amino-4,6-dideoxy-N-acetyl-beta-L-altrosamine N-acetyltransferase
MIKFIDFNLRTLSASDEERMLQWRNSDRVRCNMYNDHIIQPEEHAAWFRTAIFDTHARYLIATFLDQPIGLVSFTNINETHDRCSWAFYLGETEAPRGAGSAMEFLALTYAFEVLKIRKLCCEVFVFNAGVIKLHEKFGFTHEGRFIKHYLKNGQFEDIVCLAKFGTHWLEEKQNLKSRCFSAEKD